MGSIARTISKGLGRSCQLLGPTALVVQALMGVLAVLSLVYKRHRETQKRPWKIWLYDVSKQVVGQMVCHGLNVLISHLGSYHSAGNACTYYFLNILLDTTLGEFCVGLLYLLLQSSTWLLSEQLGIKGLTTGQYGNPPSITYWVRQATVYVFAITTMKLAVVALFAVWPDAYRIGDWLLSWTTVVDGESFQVVVVMGVFPVFMNVIQFWLIDSIVKASASSTSVRSSSPRDSDSLDCEPLFNSPDDDDGVSPSDIEHGPQSTSSRTMSEGDLVTLVDAEDSKTKLFVSGSSSPMTLPRSSAGAVAHDYPPNGVGSVSSQGSTRSRHGYKRSLSSLLDPPIASNPLDTSRNSSRQALLSKAHHVRAALGGAAEVDAWEKSGWEEQNGGRLTSVS